jgi:hypothetical protein
MIRSDSRFLTVAVATLLALTVGGFALADDTPTETDDGAGPRWLRDDAEGWLRGDQGPPPWSDARFLRDDADGWQPGDGKPPWADGVGDGDEEGDDGKGPRWLRDDADGWQPGDGKPPWAGQDDGDDVGTDDTE